MNELVYIRRNDVFTDTLVIARGTENEHRAVAVLIKRYKKQFAEIGKICFKHLKCRKYQGRPMKVYQLNEPQASFLITLLKNSEAGVEDRERANTLQLNNLLLAERVIDDSIAAGMKEGKHYKDIYAECRARLAQFKEIARLSIHDERRQGDGRKLESRPSQCGVKTE